MDPLDVRAMALPTDHTQMRNEAGTPVGLPHAIPVVTSIPPKLTRTSAGHSVGEVYQDLCTRSWIECGFKLYSVNHKDEIRDLASKYPQITFVETENNASELTGRKNPYIFDLLSTLAHHSASVVGIINPHCAGPPSVDQKNFLARQAGRR